ncbi:glucuronate isomerase [Paenibacillus rigui]|uniref:Glucuronate isomerase n=1 Tax=Paenibacillus rigui TaxID=554312 RepID=A0A229UHF1_9BACL|nr:glucuronate isomerase [Paenibacillus rigui]
MQTKQQLQQAVNRTIQATPVSDVHTRLYSEAFGELSHWGIEELLTSDALIKELIGFRTDLSSTQWRKLSKREQADIVWQTLFIDHTPYSEACRGVLKVFQRLGLDTAARNLSAYRSFFKHLNASDHMDQIFKLARVTTVCMSNNPFSPVERIAWEGIDQLDPRFNTALRIDYLVNHWTDACVQLRDWGYEVEEALSGKTCREIRSFLKYWIARMNPLYMFSGGFMSGTSNRIIQECVLPVAAEAGIPLALFISNEGWQLDDFSSAAGTSLQQADGISVLAELCAKYPGNKFLCSLGAGAGVGVHPYLLTAAARQFPNLHLVGYHGSFHIPGALEELTRLRFELAGTHVTVQHSDSDVLEQLLYKWDDARGVIGKVLYDKYSDLMNTGWRMTEDEIARDAAGLLGGDFWKFLGRPNPAVAFKA